MKIILTTEQVYTALSAFRSAMVCEHDLLESLGERDRRQIRKTKQFIARIERVRDRIVDQMHAHNQAERKAGHR